MDAYEATKIVFSRIQAVDPDNAAKIMGLLLIQDHGEKEMIRLAFGPEALVQSVVLKARKDLGLLPPTPSTPSSPSPFSRQTSASSRLGAGGSGLPSPSSWAAPLVFSRSNSVNGNGASLLGNGVVDDLSADDLIGGGGAAANGANLGGGSASPVPFYGNGDLMDDFQLQDQLSFLNDPSVCVGAGTGSSPNSSLHGLMGVNHNAAVTSGGSDLFYSDLSSECRSPSSNGSGGDILFPYAAWGMGNGHHHRSRSCSMADLYLNSDAAAAGFGGWKPCLYYARGYCKNGSSCRFQHGLADDSSAAAVAAAIAGGKMDAVVEQQCQELLLRSKSQQQQRLGASQLMASATPFPYASSSPTSANKCMNFLLQQQQQQQQSENQRAAAAAAALMLGGDDMQQHKFFGGGRSRMMADYAAGMANPGSRQIYLTFPADSTFREEDVSNYFSIYGPVQDVRIPYQQKRMFGFVTFVYPETVKIILAKGNPHFVCDARVLVKPYKEKGKIPDKKHQQQQQLDRGDFSGCTTPTGLDSRDPYDLGSRMLFNVNQEALLRRKLEEQQQAAELQQAIELQSRRFMGLNFLDLKNSSSSSSSRTLSLPVTCPSPINTGPPTPITTNTNSAAPPPPAAATTAITTRPSSQDGSPTATATTEDKCPSPNATAQQGAVNPITAATAAASASASASVPAAAAATAAADKEESAPAAVTAAAAAAGKGNPDGDGDFQESAEHNLPDSPFASPTKSCFTGAGEAFSEAADAVNPPARLVATANNINGGNHLMGSSTASLFSPTLDLRSYKSCFLQMPRFSSGHGAVGL